ncbi:MAG: Bax inhibitor-1/YccA family protein [Salinivirgaceae bacterium]|nr:Bax inhibitor-1/YccA family protein [Salinivirgaceae bacterium]
MKSSNPTLNKKILRDFAFDSTANGVMTIQGTINKIALMLLLIVGAASYTWSKFLELGQASILPWLAIGGIGGFVLAIIIVFNKKRANILAPIYAIFEGLFLGAISAMFASMYEGIVLRAVVLTFGVLFSMLFLYKTRIIKVTSKFRAGVMMATMGIAVAYFFTFILGLFGMNMGFMYGGGTMGIIISLVIVGVASLNLLLDFDFIEKGSEAGLPAYFEWYGAFGLIVTLVWLYLEILRLLSMLSGRD